MDEVSVRLDTAIEEFLLDKRSEVRPSTLTTYSVALYRVARDLPQWVDIRDVEGRSGMLMLKAYIARLQDSGMKPVTVAHIIRHLKVFVTWAATSTPPLVKDNPFSRDKGEHRLKVPSAGGPSTTRVSAEDLKRMLAVCDPATDLGRRDAAMLMFLYDTGARVSEMCALKVEDLDLKARQARVYGKGGKWRTIYMSPPTTLALSKYLTRRRQKSPYVFAGFRRTKPGDHISGNGVIQRFRIIAKKAGVTARVNPHSFRHTFATNYLSLGGDPASLQRIMGHADISTTIKNYAHVGDKETHERYDQFSPMSAFISGGRR